MSDGPYLKAFGDGVVGLAERAEASAGRVVAVGRAGAV
jgi:hypothetical protein